MALKGKTPAEAAGIQVQGVLAKVRDVMSTKAFRIQHWMSAL
jgi:hypothetical protein